LAPSPTDTPNPDGERSYRLEVKKCWVEVVTLLILGVYTLINYRLYRTTADSFHADQRPWVGVESKVEIPIAVKQPNGKYLLPGHVTVKNFGPRVARNVFTITGAVPTDDPNSVCSFAEHNCGAAWSFASGKGQEGWTVSSNEKEGVVLFPDQDRPEAVFGALEVKKKLPTEIFLPGCVVYFDQFGDPHRTLFCFKAMFDGSNFAEWYQCQVCNDAK